jgi:hypothetical protein
VKTLKPSQNTHKCIIVAAAIIGVGILLVHSTNHEGNLGRLHREQNKDASELLKANSSKAVKATRSNIASSSLISKLINQQDLGSNYTYKQLTKDFASLKSDQESESQMETLVHSSDIRIRTIAVALDTRVFKGVHLPPDFLNNEPQPIVLSAYLISELLWGSKERWKQASISLSKRFSPEDALNAYFVERKTYFSPGSSKPIQGSFVMASLFLDSESPTFMLQSIAYVSKSHWDHFTTIANSFSPLMKPFEARQSIAVNSALGIPFLQHRTPLDEKSFPYLKSKSIDSLDLRTAATVRVWQKD